MAPRSQSRRARPNGVKPDPARRSAPNRKPQLRGYLRGSRRAAEYLDIDRQTFRGWRDDTEMAHRELLQPRIINGDPYYRIANLDRFMDPACNPPGVEIANHFPKEN